MPLKPEICCGPYEKSLLKHLLFDYEQQSRYYMSLSHQNFILSKLYIFTDKVKYNVYY